MKNNFKQRGAAALAVSMVLLFGMTLAAFFANRTMIFEQRTSVNQYRSTKAFELADAGIEWAIARLNDTRTLAAGDCAPAVASGLQNFAERYIRPTAADATHPAGWFNPLTTAYPGCQINPTDGTFSCACPAAGTAALAATDQPRFRVQFNPVNLTNNPTVDTLAVEILSRGCTNGDPCDPTPTGVSSATTDSSSLVRVIVKLRPTFPTLPGAGLISGATTVISGSLNVVNTDTVSNGITINSGSTVDLTGGTTVQSLPGTAPSASVLDNDPSLLKLTNSDADGQQFFASYFGEDFSHYQENLKTKVISAGAANNAANGTCGNALDCGAAVSYWVDRGFTQFWVAPDVTFNSSNMPSTTAGGTLGTAAKPIALATPGQISFTGGVTAYGIYYAATASAVDDLTLAGGGSATIFGALVSRGNFSRTGNGNISIVYNGNLFGGLGPPSGILVPVPGSWRDKATAF